MTSSADISGGVSARRISSGRWQIPRLADMARGVVLPEVRDDPGPAPAAGIADVSTVTQCGDVSDSGAAQQRLSRRLAPDASVRRRVAAQGWTQVCLIRTGGHAEPRHYAAARVTCDVMLMPLRAALRRGFSWHAENRHQLTRLVHFTGPGVENGPYAIPFHSITQSRQSTSRC